MNQLDWDGLQLLLAVHEAGSLRGAAKGLGISQPTLGRRLEALEGQLRTPLVVRHARGVHLTPEGEVAVAASRRVRSELTELQRALTGRATEVVGRVRVSCTAPVAMRVLPPSLLRLASDHPRLSVDVVVDAHATDLDRGAADIAIRMFPPERLSLRARRVGTTRTRFYASPEYVGSHGLPERLEDLAAHRVIGPDRDALFVRQAERLGFDRESMTYRTDSFPTVWAWVAAGVAIGALLEVMGEGLVPVLEPIAEHPVWLVTHPDLAPSATVSAVWSRLVEDLPACFGRSPTGA